jgi:hypothetical protein
VGDKKPRAEPFAVRVRRWSPLVFTQPQPSYAVGILLTGSDATLKPPPSDKRKQRQSVPARGALPLAIRDVTMRYTAAWSKSVRPPLPPSRRPLRQN